MNKKEEQHYTASLKPEIIEIMDQAQIELDNKERINGYKEVEVVDGLKLCSYEFTNEGFKKLNGFERER